MTTLAYTIGNRNSYDRALEEAHRDGGVIHKLGRSQDYDGGWVFCSMEDARAKLDDPDGLRTDFGHGMTEAGIYELRLPRSWGEDVYWNGEEASHLLVVDAVIVCRVLPR